MKKIIYLFLLPFVLCGQTASVVKNYSVTGVTSQPTSYLTGNRIFYCYNNANGPVLQKNDLDGNPLAAVNINAAGCAASHLTVQGNKVIICGTKTGPFNVTAFICALDTNLSTVTYLKEYFTTASNTVTPMDMTYCNTGELVVVGSANTPTAGINRGYFISVDPSNGNVLAQQTFSSVTNFRFRAVTEISNNSLMVYCGMNGSLGVVGSVMRISKSGLSLSNPLMLSVCDLCPTFKLRKLNNSYVALMYQNSCVKIDTALSLTPKTNYSEGSATFVNVDLVNNKLIWWRGVGINNLMVMYDTSFTFLAGKNYNTISNFPLGSSPSVMANSNSIYFVALNGNNMIMTKTQALGELACSSPATGLIGNTTLTGTLTTASSSSNGVSNNLSSTLSPLTLSSVDSCLPLGIKETSNNDFEISSINNIYTLTSNAIISTCVILDITGKTLMTLSPNENTALIDLSSYPDGIYFLKAKNRNQAEQIIKVSKR